jgi:uncharacterized protein (DUF885 family)
MRKLGWLALIIAAGCAQTPSHNHSRPAEVDAEFRRLAEDYVSGYLAWRPQTGTTLGLHAYDGKLTDFSSASLAAELTRLKQFDQKLDSLPPAKMSEQISYDCRILRTAIKSEIFKFVDMQSYTGNPMTYADLIDVNIYLKRNFAPLEDRVRSIIAIEREAPKILAAARANLIESLPKPFVQTAIDQRRDRFPEQRSGGGLEASQE